MYERELTALTPLGSKGPSTTVAAGTFSSRKNWPSAAAFVAPGDDGQPFVWAIWEREKAMKSAVRRHLQSPHRSAVPALVIRWPVVRASRPLT